MVYPLTAAVLGRAGPREFAARLYRHVPLRLVRRRGRRTRGGRPSPAMPTAGLFRVLLDDGARGPMVRTTARGWVSTDIRAVGCRMDRSCVPMSRVLMST
jgi:hypothetical protein